MSELAVIDAAAAGSRQSPSSKSRVTDVMLSLRHARGLGWMNHRASFAIGMPALAVLSLVTSLYIPRLIGPADFGTYALLLNLFRYAGRSDLGLSQLADKMLSGGGGEGTAQQLLDVRFRIGAMALLFAVPAVGLGGAWLGFSPLDAVLAVAAGIFAMMCGGPSSVFRAKGYIWEYTALAFMFSLGFIVPRLAGFFIDGITGCFVLLLVWYAVVAAVFAMQSVIRKGSEPLRPKTMAIIPTLRSCLPLFAFAGVWIVFLSLSRWISAILSSPRDLGLFALGANLAVTGVTTFAQIGDVRYPKLLAAFVRSDGFSASKLIEREGMFIAAAVAVASAAFAFLAEPITSAVFPNYAGAAPAAVAMVAGCIPMTVVAWFLPVVIARSRSPLRDTVIVFAIPSLVTSAAMVIGDRFAGVTGQGWGCCIGSGVLLACFAAGMNRAAILRASAAVRLTVASCLMIFPTVGIVMARSNLGLGVGRIAIASISIGSGGGAVAETIDDKPPLLVPPQGWSRVFFDDFCSLSFWTGRAGTWETSYPGGSRTNVENKEDEYYAPSRAPAIFQPFSAAPAKGLVITARPLPPTWIATTGLHYASGLLSSAKSFGFTYGYVSMRAEVPHGKGLWPAFWLLPISRAWPPEIDVMEVLGHDTGHYYATIHANGIGRGNQIQAEISTSDLSSRLHDYGMLWTREKITWFFDGRQVAETATPGDMHVQMYLLINLAVGGKWPGAPDGSTIFPAEMTVRSVSVWQASKSKKLDGEPAAIQSEEASRAERWR